MRRRPWRNGASWTPEEAAQELHRRRQELVGQLRRRSEARGVPAAAQEEIVDDAITAVVMSSHIKNERHLLGAFWVAVDHRARRWREGRHLTRIGSRQRVELDTALERAAAHGGPFESVELSDRMARAADFMAQLDPREQQVVSVMASYGVGPVPAARLLRLPLGEVRAASRSANAKLDQVAVISAAGRMCDYRYRAIAAHAAGEATTSETTAARAHLNACVSCGRLYGQLRREMRGREFQRAAVAAFLPLPAISVAHVGGVGKLAVWIEQRISFVPRGSGERTAEVLGGAGIAKAAVAGTAIVAAGGALTGHIVHTIERAQAPARHRAHVARQVRQPVTLARGWANPTSSLAAHSSSSSIEPPSTRTTVRLPKPPSKSLGYLALGGSAAAPRSSSGARASTHQASARVASVTSTPVASESAPAPTQSGGGTNLSYLGK
jgi:hypothetical protein